MYSDRTKSFNNDLGVAALSGKTPLWGAFHARDAAVFNSIVNAPLKTRFIFWLKNAPDRRFGESSFFTELIIRFFAAAFLLWAAPFVVRVFI